MLTLPTAIQTPQEATQKSVGEVLLATIAWAQENGVDPEGALRDAARGLMAEIVQIESTVR